mgnify:CR=1 FL=1
MASDQSFGVVIAIATSFARPADTTAYVANDAVAQTTAATLSFDFNRNEGYITKARLMTDQAANVAQFRLHLFTTAPTAIADNSPYTQLWANRAAKIGMIDIGPLATEGTGSDAALGLNTDIRLPFSGDVLYGLLETKTAFTPASAQNFYIELTLEAN